MTNQTAIIPAEKQTTIVLVPAIASRNRRSRLARFSSWLESRGQPWHDPALAAWRDDLQEEGLAPASVSAYLSTVRGRYAEILRDNQTRDILYTLAGEELQRLGQEDNVANRAAAVGELETRLKNALDPETAPVKTTTHQDRPDQEHLRLTREQASSLLEAPSCESAQGLRDTALIGLLLCTGIREAELVSLDVADLRKKLGGELALNVREGKGKKERCIPYGALDWVLAIVDQWLEIAGISEGAVFRGFYKDGRRLRPGRLSVRQAQNVLKRYPVMVDGQLVTVRPHDCRRTYARRLYEAGMDIVAIQQNLGHADHKTTLGYIGELDAGRRRPPAVYTFDLGALANVPVQGEF